MRGVQKKTLTTTLLQRQAKLLYYISFSQDQLGAKCLAQGHSNIIIIIIITEPIQLKNVQMNLNNKHSYNNNYSKYKVKTMAPVFLIVATKC